MSALPSTSDLRRRTLKFRFVPKSGLMRANSIAYGGDEELDKPHEDRSNLPIEKAIVRQQRRGGLYHCIFFSTIGLITRSVTGLPLTHIPNRSASGACK